MPPWITSQVCYMISMFKAIYSSSRPNLYYCYNLTFTSVIKQIQKKRAHFIFDHI